MEKDILWFGHDTFRFEGEKIIYTDPYRIRKRDKADIILITHDHHDHCSPDDVELVRTKGTVIVATGDCAKKLSGDVRIIRPGEKLSINGVDVEAVPAYNIDKAFHPKEKGWVGYIFGFKGRRVYIAGDTDLTPEMKKVRADIAVLPVSGTYVMTAEEAVKAALVIGPGVAIPMHFGSVVGSRKDAERFAEGLRGKVDVTIPEEDKLWTATE